MICARRRRGKRSGAREPRGTRVPGAEGTGGAVTRRRSFWLAVSGSGRRVAFHEAAGSKHHLRESTVFCIHPRVHPRPRANANTPFSGLRSYGWHVIKEAISLRYRRNGGTRGENEQPASDKSPTVSNSFH